MINAAMAQGMTLEDALRESEIGYLLGCKFKEEDKNDKAIEQWKKVLVSAIMVGDDEGTALALNRLGICYYSKGYFTKSSFYHQRLKEVSKQNTYISAISAYNFGLSLRQIELEKVRHATQEMKFADSIANFEESVNDSAEHVIGGLQAGMLRMVKDHEMHDLNAAEEQLMVCRATITS